jgi:hypothetical protein
MPWDFNLEIYFMKNYKALQQSLSVLEHQIANFIFLKLFLIKYIESEILEIFIKVKHEKLCKCPLSVFKTLTSME